MNLLSVALVLTAAVAIVLVAYPWPSRRVKRALARREEVRIEEALANRFASSEIDLSAAADLWRSLAACFPVSPGQLRLTDRFAVELDSKRLLRIDDELSCVNMVLSRAASTRNAKIDLSKLLTIEDCIIAVCGAPSAEDGQRNT